jgi:hypothetical protein
MGIISAASRHFDKYTSRQRAVILIKLSLVMGLMSLSLTITGLLLDRYHGEGPRLFEFRNNTYEVPGVWVGSRTLRMTPAECADNDVRDFSDSILFSHRGVSFADVAMTNRTEDEWLYMLLDNNIDQFSNNFFGDFASFARMGYIARLLALASALVQGISLVIMVVTRTPPAPWLSDRPIFNQSVTEHIWGGVHHGATFLGAVLLGANMAVMSTFLGLVVGRCLHLSQGMCGQRIANEMERTKFFGYYLKEHASADGVSFYLFTVAILLIYFQSLLVFYLGAVELKSKSTNRIPPLALRALPWYARFRPIWVTGPLFILSICAYYASQFLSRVRGYKLNLFLFDSVQSSSAQSASWAQSGALIDAIVDLAGNYYISENVANIVTFSWLPLLLMLGIGSVDFRLYVSKCLEIFALLTFLKSITGVSTIPATPSPVIQRPQCYDPPPELSLWNVFKYGQDCNNLMFPIQSTVVAVPAVFVLLFIRYGPVKYKWIAWAGTVAGALPCLCLIIIARLHYTADVYIGTVITVLYVLTQSGAFKLLFHFPPAVRPGDTKTMIRDRIVPLLAECVNRLEAYKQSLKRTPGLALPRETIEEIRTAFQTVKESAKRLKPTQPAQTQAQSITPEKTSNVSN